MNFYQPINENCSHFTIHKISKIYKIRPEEWKWKGYLPGQEIFSDGESILDLSEVGVDAGSVLNTQLWVVLVLQCIYVKHSWGEHSPLLLHLLVLLHVDIFVLDDDLRRLRSMFPHIGLGFLQVLSWNIDWSQRVSYFTQSSSLNCAVLGDSSLNLDFHHIM